MSSALIVLFFAIGSPFYIGVVPLDHFHLAGDTVQVAALFKNLAFGQIYGNPQTAWPLGMSAAHVPFADLFSVLLAWPLAATGADPILIYLVMVPVLLALNA